MPYIVLLFLILYIGAIPGIIIGGYHEKKGVPNKAIVTFSAPDGTRRQTQIDVTWSWTVFVFRGWSLAMRGQFLDFLIMMLVSLFTIGGGALGIAMIAIFNSAEAVDALGTVTDYFSALDAWSIVMWVAMVSVYLAVTNYYVAYANKRRISMYMQKGFDFSQTPNMAELYSYVGATPRKKPEDLGKNVKQGQTHEYVVPEKEAEETNSDDYSMLTVNDLKLLLKSEGVPFPTSATKDQLLELVDEFVKDKK